MPVRIKPRFHLSEKVISPVNISTDATELFHFDKASYETSADWWFHVFLSLCVSSFVSFVPRCQSTSRRPQEIIVYSRAGQTAVSLRVLPSLPHLCALLINWDFAWLSFKRPLEKTARLGCESLNLPSELWVFKSQGIMGLPNGEDKIQQCTNYGEKNGVLCDAGVHSCMVHYRAAEGSRGWKAKRGK